MLEYIYKFQLLIYDDSGFLLVELVKDEAVRSLVGILNLFDEEYTIACIKTKNNIVNVNDSKSCAALLSQKIFIFVILSVIFISGNLF